MKISELIKELEAKKEEYGDVKVVTQPNETVVLVIEGEDKEPEMVEYVPILDTEKSVWDVNARRIGLRLDGRNMIRRE